MCCLYRIVGFTTDAASALHSRNLRSISHALALLSSPTLHIFVQCFIAHHSKLLDQKWHLGSLRTSVGWIPALKAIPGELWTSRDICTSSRSSTYKSRLSFFVAECPIHGLASSIPLLHFLNRSSNEKSSTKLNKLHYYTLCAARRGSYLIATLSLPTSPARGWVGIYVFGLDSTKESYLHCV